MATYRLKRKRFGFLGTVAGNVTEGAGKLLDNPIAGTVGAFKGGSLGATIGSAFGPLGTVAGAVAGSVLGNKLIKGTGQALKDTGNDMKI